MSGFSDYLDTDGRPRMPGRDQRGRFSTTAKPLDDGGFTPVGPHEATGRFSAGDVDDLMRRLDEAEAAAKAAGARDARAWPRAVVASVSTVALLTLLGWLAYLVAVLHLFGL